MRDAHKGAAEYALTAPAQKSHLRQLGYRTNQNRLRIPFQQIEKLTILYTVFQHNSIRKKNNILFPDSTTDNIYILNVKYIFCT